FADARRHTALGECSRYGECHQREAGGYCCGDCPSPSGPRPVSQIAPLPEPRQAARHIWLPFVARTERRHALINPAANIVFAILFHVAPFHRAGRTPSGTPVARG